VEYFSSHKEMLEKARYLLSHPHVRDKMREAVFQRLAASGENTYFARIQTVIHEAAKSGVV